MEDPEKNIALVAILPLRLAEKTFLVNILATAQAKDKFKFSAMLLQPFLIPPIPSGRQPREVTEGWGESPQRRT